MVKIQCYILVTLFVLASSNMATAALLHVNDPSLPASADGFNITRDTSTGLDWLDVAVSAGRSYEDLTGVDGSNEFDPGGDFAGFRYATFLDLDGNFQSSQIDSLLKSANLGVMSFSSLGTYSRVKDLLDYVGCSGNCGGYGYAYGTILNNSMEVKEVSVETFFDFFGNWGRVQNGDSVPLHTSNTTGFPVVKGNWLVRDTVVPVPAAVWLFGSGLIGLIGIARRKKT